MDFKDVIGITIGDIQVQNIMVNDKIIWESQI